MLKSAQDYYGQTIKATSELKTTACCGPAPKEAAIRDALKQVHADVSNRYYGCGSPFPSPVNRLKGKTVLDLGCGTGRDCFVLSQLVGERGRVVGVDATREQLDVGRAALAWHKGRHPTSSPIEFHEGDISDLHSLVASDSVDFVVSNCVLNLAEDKKSVFAEIARVLRSSGELHFADVFVDQRLDTALKEDPVLLGECLAGAHYQQDLAAMMHELGFGEMQVLNRKPIEVADGHIRAQLGPANFESLTVKVKLGV